MAKNNKPKFGTATGGSIKPDDLSMEALSYIAEYSTLNLEPITSGQIVGAERYDRQIDVQSNILSIASSSAEETLYTYTLGGGTLGANGAVQLFLNCDHLNNSGANRSLTLRVKYGATTMHDSNTGSVFPVLASRRPVWLVLVLSAESATGTQNLIGLWAHHNTASAPTSGTGSIGGTPIFGVFGGSASEDSTLNKALTVTAQHSFSSSSLVLRRQYAALTKIGH